MASIEAALADLALQDSPNYTATAKKFNINRSTLSRRHRGKTASVKKSKQTTSILSNQQEKELIRYINKLTERGIPPPNAMIRVFAYNISGKQPGKNCREPPNSNNQNINMPLSDLVLQQAAHLAPYVPRFVASSNASPSRPKNFAEIVAIDTSCTLPMGYRTQLSGATFIMKRTERMEYQSSPTLAQLWVASGSLG